MTIRCGVLGYGFMGRVHHASYEAAAAAGIDCSVRVLDSIDDLADIDALSVCTPTDSHVELACRALEGGVHVLLEKPVALDVASIKRVARVAAASGTLCMPAHCMRFWPGWPYLRDVVHSGVLGAVRHASFERIGAAPQWNPGFYSDVERSGGALFDLHIHDADFVLWCFGEPSSVSASGSVLAVSTTYGFDGFEAAAKGAWLEADTPFQMKYQVVFEQGTLDFSFDRETPLMLRTATAFSAVNISGESAYDLQARHFLESVNSGVAPIVTLEDAARVTALLARERAQVTGDRPKEFPAP